jgi:uncharacterized membrane protein
VGAFIYGPVHGFMIWNLFLAAVPAALTDVVHMVGAMRYSSSDRHSYLVIATYAALFAGGMASYAFSMQLFHRYLHRAVADRVVVAGAAVFATVAVGAKAVAHCRRWLPFSLGRS